jgi:hypothetical protein
MVRLGKNTQKGQKPKKVLWYNVGLRQGEEPDEITEPILWTERPTGAPVGAGSLWSLLSLLATILYIFV